MLVYLRMLSFFRRRMPEKCTSSPGIKNAEAENIYLKNLEMRKRNSPYSDIELLLSALTGNNLQKEIIYARNL